MPDPTPPVGTFRPDLLARMAAAYDAALIIAGDEGSPFAHVPAPALRTGLARLIIEGARAGVADVDLLKARALCGLAASPKHRAM